MDEDEVDEVQEIDEDEPMQDGKFCAYRVVRILMRFISTEFDLDTATGKSLIRLRRDDLVRLCETRDLDVDGTKPQLAKALLEWRG